MSALPALAATRGQTAPGAILAAVLLAGVLALAGCGSTPRPLPPDTGVSPLPREAGAVGAGAPGEVLQRSRSRWVPVDWTELPGWQADRTAELWPALLQGCERPVPAWQRLCTSAKAMAMLGSPNDADARAWLQERLQPYRVESPEGAVDGLVTGYFEPQIEARRLPQANFRVPLYVPPGDLFQRTPYWTRQQIDTLPAAQASFKSRDFAYVSDPLDALVLQIQGSGRLLLTEPDGSRKLVRAAFAGHNNQPYKSVGRWLIEQRELKPEQASWPAIKAWAQRNPARQNELLWSNPRVVFFREEPVPDPTVGPKGAQGVPLTPGRSIAVDPQRVPYGTPVWLDTTEPLTATPLRRLVMAQDTGTAITGAVRADYFWGWGNEAEQQAGRMKQNLRMWALWPK